MLTYIGIAIGCLGCFELYLLNKGEPNNETRENIIQNDHNQCSSFEHIHSFLQSKECGVIFKESNKLLNEIIQQFIENKDYGGIGYNGNFSSTVYSYQINVLVSQTQIVWEVLDFSIEETEPAHTLFSVVYDRHLKTSVERLSKLQKNGQMDVYFGFFDLNDEQDIPFILKLKKQLHDINESGWNRGETSIPMTSSLTFAKMVSVVEGIKKGYLSSWDAEIHEKLEEILKLSHAILGAPFFKELAEDESAYDPFDNLNHLMELKVIDVLRHYKLTSHLNQSDAKERILQSLQIVYNHFAHVHQNFLHRQKLKRIENTTEMMIQEQYYW